MINLILIVFISGIIVFFLKYHRRKFINEKEKALLNEQHAQELLHSKLEIQQQTMQDIGREIHDNVGQLLTVASLYAHQLAYENKDTTESEKVSEIGKIVDRSLDELRTLSKNLTNEKAEMEELADLLREECARLNTLGLCNVTFICNETDFTLSVGIKNLMLRIVQEFIQNSLKHAHCKNIELSFSYAPDGLNITMHDDGKGFDLNDTTKLEGKGIGLKNMQKRAELIGASFIITSMPGKGTSLSMFIPTDKLKLY